MARDGTEFDDRSPANRAFDTITALARQAGMLRDVRVQRALKALALNPFDSRLVREITSQTTRLITTRPEFLAQQGDQNPFQPYPGPIVNGPIVLGRVFHPRRHDVPTFGLHLRELNENVLIGGRAGSGKTNLIMIILINLMRLLCPFLILDFKRDYRHLIRRFPGLRVFSWRTFKFNPLVPPPGTDFLYWSQIVADLFFDAFFPTPAAASKSAFLNALLHLYGRFQEWYEGDVYPCMFDQQEEMTTAEPEGPDRTQACLNRLRPLLLLLHDMFDCQVGFSLEDLLEAPVVLELDGLTQEIQTFLVNVLFYWIFTYRLGQTQRGTLKHVLIFDEAKMVFSKEKASGAAPIARLVSTAREMGQGLVCADQMPSTLGHALLANVFVLIALSLSARKDMQDMAYAMGLHDGQREYLNHLPIGLGVVKMADRYTQPFLVRFPRVDVAKDVTDAELEEYMTPHLVGLRWQPRVCGRIVVAPEPEDTGLEHTTPQDEHLPLAAAEADDAQLRFPFDLSEREFTVLTDIKNRPFVATVERFRSLRLTNYMGNRITRRLNDRDLVAEVEIKVGRRGRARKFMELTQAAENAVGRQNLGPGKGGFEHVFHQQRLQRHFTALGYEARIEEFRNGKAADLGLTKDGQRIAVEIAMSPPGELSNIQKDYAAGWREVWVLCGDAGIKQQVEAEWEANKASLPDCSVTFFLVSDPRFDTGAEGTADEGA